MRLDNMPIPKNKPFYIQIGGMDVQQEYKEVIVSQH